MISLRFTLGAAGASMLVAGGTKGLSALGAFFEAGGAEDMQLIIADRIPAPGIEAGFAGQGVPFSEQGIIGQGERPGRKASFNLQPENRGVGFNDDGRHRFDADIQGVFGD